ncbi:MAG: MATE family efflux transporter, partial [Lachnospiraceae bacterium]|nr:MATE family efflux transporter [Lachnospiraceae bacterium]
MTEGRPAKKITAFMIPMLIGNVAQQLYNTADSIIVGRFVGDNALAAVGSAGPIFNLLLVLFVGVSMGATIMVSQYFGARERESLSKAVGTSILMTILTSLIIMILTPFVTMPLLRLLHTPETIIYWCDSYLKILFIGVMGCAFYNILGGILRGLGDSLSALIYLLVATVINIVLDYVFVAKLSLGVAGVAYATVIAQLISAILSLRKLSTMTDLFDLKLRYIKPDRAFLAEII